MEGWVFGWIDAGWRVDGWRLYRWMGGQSMDGWMASGWMNGLRWINVNETLTLLGSVKS